jgi:D-alanyl-D-alanine carboxypeptidase/D-alanyl-D-alanine-endopeptidase (penicillin-binding protein 4)
MKYRLTLTLPLLVFLFSCSISKQIAKSAKENVLKDDALETAHVGISIYDPATGKYWYNYQGDKYFVPASNTKLPTCYAAMKYLGDSLVGLLYGKTIEDNIEIKATGDPTLLHPDFKKQPVLDFLKRQKSITVFTANWKENAWGSGWGWSDYDAAYMAERSPMPVFGNIVSFAKGNERSYNSATQTYSRNAIATPNIFQDSIREHLDYPMAIDSFEISRELGKNLFHLTIANRKFYNSEIPFVTYGFGTALKLLGDTLKMHLPETEVDLKPQNKVYSQPTDSLLKPMMHRSDNFFAEQSLLMVSNELLGVMNDAKIIDALLKTDFKDLPQKPRWVDGSGLSRYNLFTPQDFVFILNKMKTDFGMDRIKTILPTGNEGTLEGRFVRDSNYIFAKTGTLSGVVSLSGFLYTKKNKLLVFSVLVNNHNSSASQVRSAVEKFIDGIRQKY